MIQFTEESDDPQSIMSRKISKPLQEDPAIKEEVKSDQEEVKEENIDILQQQIFVKSKKRRQNSNSQVKLYLGGTQEF